MAKDNQEELGYLGHRRRLRKRFKRSGAEGLLDYELLELLLTYAIPRRDVKPIAKALLEEFGSLGAVLDANIDELTGKKIKGLGETSATLIKLVKELCSYYFEERLQHRDFISSPQAVVNFARAKLSGEHREAFMVIFLNVKNQVLGYEIITRGTIDRAPVYPRDIIKSALDKHAAALVLVHNHPSGYPEPSPEDKQIVKAITEAAEVVEIKVLDHIIVGKEGHFSFKERCLMPAA